MMMGGAIEIEEAPRSPTGSYLPSTGSFTPLPFDLSKKSVVKKASIFHFAFKVMPFMLVALIIFMMGIIFYGRQSADIEMPMIERKDPDITVDSVPGSGRTFMLNSQLKGLKVKIASLQYTKNTSDPLEIKDLPPQSQYFLEISKTGYETITDTIKINDNQTFEMTIKKMTPIGATGHVVLETIPKGAVIYVDEVRMGNVTPATISLPVGQEVDVKLTRHGYLEKKIKVKIGREGDVERKMIQLVSTSPNTSKKIPAVLRIDSTPANAYVYVDSDYVCRTPCIYKRGYITDTLDIDIVESGYKTFSTSFNLQSDTNYINAALVQASMGYGFLSITSTPSGSNVFIDGKLIGKTPLDKYKLKNGRHKIKLATQKKKANSVVKVISIEENQYLRKHFVIENAPYSYKK